MNNELHHHGVKGMKWGIRKASKKKSSNRPKKRSSKKNIKNSVEKGKALMRKRSKQLLQPQVAGITALRAQHAMNTVNSLLKSDWGSAVYSGLMAASYDARLRDYRKWYDDVYES